MTLISGVGSENTSPATTSFLEGETSGGTSEHFQIINLPLGGGYGSCGLLGTNNATTPNTKMDFSADIVALRRSTGNVVVRTNTGTITNDLTLPASGSTSTANGCDQSKLSAEVSIWVHYYWIWDGSTLATLASQTAPPTGPTLPSGYTHWAYLGAVYLDASSHLLSVRLQGNTVHYAEQQTVLNGGTSAVEATISVSAVIPPNATNILTQALLLFVHTAAGANCTCYMRWKTGINYASISQETQIADVSLRANGFIEFPNLSQTLYYIISKSAGTGTAYMFVYAYRVPNGSC